MFEERLGEVGCSRNNVVVVSSRGGGCRPGASPAVAATAATFIISISGYPEPNVNAGDLDLDRAGVDVDRQSDAEQGDLGFSNVEGRWELQELLEDLKVWKT